MKILTQLKDSTILFEANQLDEKTEEMSTELATLQQKREDDKADSKKSFSEKLKDNAPSAGAIFGIVFASIVGVAALGGLFVFLKNKMSGESEEYMEVLQE